MKLGVVDVGGGLRGVYAAGVFDSFIKHNVDFDICIGVSAGSANITSYMAGQYQRNLKFYTEYAMRPQYMSFRNMIKKGSYIGLEYIYATLSNSDGENPLDYPAMMASCKDFRIVATDAETGKPVYFDQTNVAQDDYRTVMASCTVPVVNKAFDFDGKKYYDGGLSDPIPFEKAFELGADKVVVILTRPKDFRRDPEKDNFAYKMLRRKYPGTAEAVKKRAEVYNAQLDRATELEKEGKVIIVAPDSIEGLKTLTKDKEILLKMYDKGIKDGENKEVLEFVI